ncbi:PIG-U-domain-containing protein [Desarmillaria tabescens]|uniref:PIG-U-domain-containing protein n=1 Tax=Armillaria tabescens TaxID=1929756 RepID=A0AA39N364_ARMTA|nr:PIG-U-domain-containing protein [Desarmillaria tabescens]KAK0455525.1 PIG-U-domain-containing protein [Desarmillaria tabescens]
MNTFIHDHQLSSPLTSFLNLKEGIYLFNNGVDPYSGGVFRHVCSLHYTFPFFTTILSPSRITASILWTLCDSIGAWSMIRIWRARQRVAQSSRDILVATMYFLNPYLFLPSLAFSTSSIENAVCLLAIMFACERRTSASLLALAFLIQLSLSSALLITPIILLLMTNPTSQLASPRPFSGKWIQSLGLIVELTVYSIVLTLASTLVSGSFLWISQTWGASLTLPDLTPNPGLWWYFFTEMFDHFRPFFLMVFTVHLLTYIAPICIKFQYDTLYATFLLVGVLGIFKAYPTLSDPGLFLSMISLFPEIYPYFRHPIVTSLLHLHAAMLLPLFHKLWLAQGTGNANFFYASTLVFACANGVALVDCVWAGLRIAIGEEVDGYTVTQE